MGIRESIGSFGVRKAIAVLAVVTSFTGLGFSQIAVQEPSSRDDVKACADYAEEVLRDRWDMNERTDLGWRIFNTVEEPKSYMKDIAFSNGIFSAVSLPIPGHPTDSDINIFILDSAYPGSAYNGKNGTNFPINADKYKIFAVRMNTTLYLPGPGQIAQLLWSKNTIYGGVTTSNAMTIRNGWNYVIVKIPDLGIAAGSDAWAGLIDSLRLDPFYEPDRSIQIDWIRLVEEDTSTQRTVRWSGNSGNVDIYLDNDTNPANGNLGTLARSASGGSYTFLAGALMPGDYYVALAPAGATTYTYADGYYHVNAAPILNFTKPTAEGSTDDFITASFNDPWDMANSEDVEYTERLVNPRFDRIDYEDAQGGAHNNQTVYLSGAKTSTVPADHPVGDPTVFFFHFHHRAATTQIDTRRYHNLTFKMGIAGAPCVNDGSIARVMWRIMGESYENETQDLIVHHMGGRWIMDKITLDLGTVLQETIPPLSTSGWTGMVESLRIDPHEFPDGREFFFDDVKLAADWTADGSFPIEWTLADSDGSSTVSLYYDTNSSGYDGTLITTLPGVAAGAGSYTWNTTSVAKGTYWIYARIDDGTNVNTSYAGGPVIVRNAGAIPSIGLDRTGLFFGSSGSAATTKSQTILIRNAGSGTLTWSASSPQSWISVTPSSGAGAAKLSVSVNPAGLATGTHTGAVNITAAGADNSPQSVAVTLKVYAAGGTSAPFGVFDTPIHNSKVRGSISVTGWALDDIEVTEVEVRRGPVTGDPAGAIGADGLIYVGDATFVEGARPDVEAAQPSYPLNTRAGWGYMLLTYGLPDKGNGTFVLHAVAFDRDGHRSELGTKTIVSDNANNTKPFGAIDTPGQGGTTSGNPYVNFGWVLTPPPAMVPTNGSTIWLWIDGVQVGHPTYNQFRLDVHDAYPDYLNADGAVGFYYIDTTAYADGMHTIGWSATDDHGQAEGMGSRFFWVFNEGAGAGAAALGTRNDISVIASPDGLQSRDSGRVQTISPSGCIGSLVDLAGIPADVLSPIYLRTGFRDAGLHEVANPDAHGIRSVTIEETGRLVISLDSPEKLPDEGRDLRGKRSSNRDSVELTGAVRWSGYLVVGNELRPLPIGSTLDARRGVFFWQPGPGFLGTYRFVFVNGRDGKKKFVTLNIRPKSFPQRS